MKTIHIEVVGSGTSCGFKITPQLTIGELAERCLNKSGNAGQPIAEWEMRNADGHLLEHGVTLKDAGVVSGQTLYMSPRAGIGGGGD